jgi:hypothetical protein
MKKKTKIITGCPICGGHWKRLSGFLVCASCGHRYDEGQRYTDTPDDRPRDHGHVLPTSSGYDNPAAEHTGRSGEIRYDHGVKDK